jgi:hypothetical protein
VATSLKSYKQINNWCNIKRVSVAVYCCKRSERKQKCIFEGRDSSLVVVALFQLVNGDFLQENIVNFFKNEQWKSNGFLFTKTGKHCLLYQSSTS